MDQQIITSHTFHIFEPKGWLDTYNSPEFESQLTDVMSSGTKYVVIDCHDLDYISSAGLRILVKIAKQLSALQGLLVLCSLEEYVGEIIELSGLNELFPIAKNRDDALCKVRNTFW